MYVYNTRTLLEITIRREEHFLNTHYQYSDGRALVNELEEPVNHRWPKESCIIIIKKNFDPSTRILASLFAVENDLESGWCGCGNNDLEWNLLWSYSTIVLSWIRLPPNQLTTYIYRKPNHWILKIEHKYSVAAHQWKNHRLMTADLIQNELWWTKVTQRRWRNVITWWTT